MIRCVEWYLKRIWIDLVYNWCAVFIDARKAFWSISETLEYSEKALLYADGITREKGPTLTILHPFFPCSLFLPSICYLWHWDFFILFQNSRKKLTRIGNSVTHLIFFYSKIIFLFKLIIKNRGQIPKGKE